MTMKVTVKCDCCGDKFEAVVPDTCSKSCGAKAREARRHRRKRINGVSAKAFLQIAQPHGAK